MEVCLAQRNCSLPDVICTMNKQKQGLFLISQLLVKQLTS